MYTGIGQVAQAHDCIVAGVRFRQAQLFPDEGKQQEIVGLELVGEARPLRREGCGAVVLLFDQSVFRQGVEHFRNTGLLDGERRGDVLGVDRVSILAQLMDDKEIAFFS